MEVVEPIVYFDLETAGLLPQHPIIQLAAVAHADGRILDTFEAKIKFDESLADPAALAINGYTREAWANAEEPIEVARKFARFLEPYKTVEMISKKNKPYRIAQLSGYNVQGFDMEKLIKFFEELGVFLPAYYLGLDVLQLVMWYFRMNKKDKPKSYKLGVVCEHFGVPLLKAHDALEDIIATANLVEIVGERIADYILSNFVRV